MSFFSFQKIFRTETVTERVEEGWAKVSERVVEVVTEEVFKFFIHFHFVFAFIFNQ